MNVTIAAQVPASQRDRCGCRMSRFRRVPVVYSPATAAAATHSAMMPNRLTALLSPASRPDAWESVPTVAPPPGRGGPSVAAGRGLGEDEGQGRDESGDGGGRGVGAPEQGGPAELGPGGEEGSGHRGSPEEGVEMGSGGKALRCGRSGRH